MYRINLCNYFLFSLFFLFAFSCTNNKEQKKTDAEQVISVATIKCAKGFSIEYYKYYKLLKVFNPSDSTKISYQYVLYYNDSLKPVEYGNAQYVKIPVKSFASLSSLYIAYAEKLGKLENMVAVSDSRYIYSPLANNMVKAGKVKDVGSENSLNIERLIEVNPELVIAYQTNASSKLREAGLKLAINNEQFEITPLGRMEWIKFVAAFFDKDALADSVFNKAEKEYNGLVKLASVAKIRPTVFADIKYGDGWYMPGGKSYQANLMKDAYGHYLWEDDTKRGSILLSFESVYAKAGNADLWINTSDWTSIGEALRNDQRYAKFKALQDGNMYNNNERINEHGGNDYWESGVVNPQEVLADLIQLFHPELLPERELIYYKKLKP